jgi:alpha-L-fucosidase
MAMTAKHHEGFCLFDSQLTDCTAAKAAAGRDLVGESRDVCE